METVTLTLDEVLDLAMTVLTRHGCDKRNADAVAQTIWAAERDEAHSHGLFRLPGYVASLKSGKANGRADPTVTHLAPGAIRVHGDMGFASLALAVGRPPLAEAACQNGVAVLAINRTHHFAALWPETAALAEMGLAAMAVTSASTFVAPAGGTKPLFGTNPMSFAWPRPDGPPVVFDQASSAMARGEIQLAARDGHGVPEGVGIDVAGNPTTDPAEILKGAQLPFGGYKGSGIALMIELLAGPLINEVCSFEATEQDNKDGGPATGGEFVLALDPTRFGAGEGALAHGEALFERMLAQDGVRLPGDRRYAARERTPEAGAQIPQSLHKTILALLD
jgi:delta1-piperideine-2-carboxylate reductase